MLQALDANNPALLQQLTEIAAQAKSPELDDRRKAEKAIAQFQDAVDHQTGFVVLLLHAASVPTNPAAAFCAIVLKNTVKMCWDARSVEHCIQESDKTIIRQSIIGATLQAAPSVRRSLAEAVTLIAAVDFPTHWPYSISIIAKTLEEHRDIQTLETTLSLAHGLLSQYRDETRHDEKTAVELREIDRIYVPQLVEVLKYLLSVLRSGVVDNSAASSPTQLLPTAAGGDDAVRRVACVALTHAFESMYDLLTFDFGDEFDARKNDIVDALMGALQIDTPALMGTHDSAGCLVHLKKTTIMCVTRMLVLFDADFEVHAGGFLQIVWDFIASPGSSAPAMDDVVVGGIELIQSACNGVKRDTFAQTFMQEKLCSDVILPNMTLTEEDISNFEVEPEVYMQKDIEGSNMHTRRRAASDLLRALMMQFPSMMTPLFNHQIQVLMQHAETDMRAKDTLIYLVAALYVHEEQQRTSFSSGLPFTTMLEGTILPLLANPGTSPLIQADALRFIATFRARLTAVHVSQMIPLFTPVLRSPSEVVATYAAHTIERILSIPELAKSPAVCAAFAQNSENILGTLCTSISSSTTPNAYMMKCLMRIGFVYPEYLQPFAGAVVSLMANVLMEAAKNPSNPLFSHCLFEVLATCVNVSPEHAASIEAALWSSIMYVLVNDVLEYVPYVLQLIAQLVNMRGPAQDQAMPQHLEEILQPLVNPRMYASKGNIPAITRLLCAFLRCYPKRCSEENLVQSFFNMFGTLVASKQFDHEGLNLLTAMILYLPRDRITPKMPAVYNALMTRLQRSITNKYRRIVVLFFTVLVISYGASAVAGQLNAVQPGLLAMLLKSVWLPTVTKVMGDRERKMCVVALTRILVECSDDVLLQAKPEIFTETVRACIKVINAGVETDDVSSFMPQAVRIEDITSRVEDESVINVYRQLQSVKTPVIDVAESIHDPNAYFRQNMRHLLSGPNGQQLTAMLQGTLGQEMLQYVA